MSVDYRKKHIKAPTSYQQLTSNRPTKKRTFNYVLSQENSYERIRPVQSNRSKVQAQDFSFQGSQSSHKTDETKIRSYPFSGGEEGRQEKVYDPSQTKELSKKYEIDERLSNITSINHKITGLLNTVKNKKQDYSSIYTSSRNQETSQVQATYLEKDIALSDDLINDESAYRQKVRSALRVKYGISEQENASSQEQVPKRINFKYSDLIESRIAGQSNDTQSYLKQVEKENPLILGPLRTKLTNLTTAPLSDAELNIRQDNEKRQKILIENLILDRQIQEKKQKIFAGSPFNPKKDSPKQTKQPQTKKQKTSPKVAKLTEKPQVLRLAQSLSKLIQLDMVMFKFRQSFQSLKDPKKWPQLMDQLHSRNIYLEEKDVKQYVAISIHEKNPFANNNSLYSLNQSKDLAKLMAEAEDIWNQEIEKCVSLDLLAEDDFSMSVIDFSSKGTISLEDLVCFVNVNSQKFYRSREVAGLFRRFLKLQGKSLDKGISIGISYGTFMDKVSR